VASNANEAEEKCLMAKKEEAKSEMVKTRRRSREMKAISIELGQQPSASNFRPAGGRENRHMALAAAGERQLWLAKGQPAQRRRRSLEEYMSADEDQLGKACGVANRRSVKAIRRKLGENESRK